MTSRPDIPLATVLRDTREQEPLSPCVLRVYRGEAVREYLATRDVCLRAGDYALDGHEEAFFIERKSTADLWGSLFGRAPNNSVGEAQRSVDRLRREFARASGYHRRVLLIETDLGSFEEQRPTLEESPRTLVAYARQRYERNGRRGRSPEENVLSIVEMLASFLCDYGVTPLWAGSRRGAELWLGMTLTRAWSQAHGGEKARVARGRGVVLPWMATEEARDGVRDQVAPGERSRGLPRELAAERVAACEVGPAEEGAAIRDQERGADVGAAVGRGACTGAEAAPQDEASGGGDAHAGVAAEPVAARQSRTSLTGATAFVHARHSDRWRVTCPGSTRAAFLTDAEVLAAWPLLAGAAEPAPPDARVTQILAERDPLLGVAPTWSEHARRSGAKRRGRMGA